MYVRAVFFHDSEFCNDIHLGIFAPMSIMEIRQIFNILRLPATEAELYSSSVDGEDTNILEADETGSSEDTEDSTEDESEDSSDGGSEDNWEGDSEEGFDGYGDEEF
ncbi:hypothetical protein FRX31_002335 [Thalictrum thalictroides]|uniref:Uncharacterized protein n=1 Tax=Thalictrum thalictroides TaxID=46969 RepID=A0A7J6XG91_THATH|nr:hypothetical protein FRX31_002335 [Thalictrum thalictroides]